MSVQESVCVTYWVVVAAADDNEIFQPATHKQLSIQQKALITYTYKKVIRG